MPKKTYSTKSERRRAIQREVMHEVVRHLEQVSMTRFTIEVLDPIIKCYKALGLRHLRDQSYMTSQRHKNRGLTVDKGAMAEAGFAPNSPRNLVRDLDAPLAARITPTIHNGAKPVQVYDVYMMAIFFLCTVEAKLYTTNEAGDRVRDKEKEKVFAAVRDYLGRAFGIVPARRRVYPNSTPEWTLSTTNKPYLLGEGDPDDEDPDLDAVFQSSDKIIDKPVMTDAANAVLGALAEGEGAPLADFDMPETDLTAPVPNPDADDLDLDDYLARLQDAATEIRGVKEKAAQAVAKLREIRPNLTESEADAIVKPRIDREVRAVQTRYGV